MAELHGKSLAVHLQAIMTEFKAKGSIYGYPKRKMYLGFDDVDLGVDFHGRRAETLLGPASGPHSQMVQNIVLSFLGGGRIMELKTVQILDRLEIPRPCIDVRNIGFNVEWSQEMRLEDSFEEYVTAWVLLKLLEEMELLGVPKGAPFYDTIFDISVGYDLKGIQSARMHKWLSDFKNAGPAIERILSGLPPKFTLLKETRVDPKISNSVTLSTFHGCPADEIESIVTHLIREHGFHVIVKMNPTILGYDFVEEMLIRKLGYHHISLDRAAFEHDMKFDEAVAMMQCLQKVASRQSVKVGAKFTNTLVVKNNETIFSDDTIYLSGTPLHVLAMNAMHHFRQAMGADFHISFSAGITKHNFVDTVLCNIKPVTTCTDLLKEGGYTRLSTYLARLRKAMTAADVTRIDDFICKAGGKTDRAESGMATADRLVATLADNPAYHHAANSKTPPKIESHLELFDCITCNKCLPVCPNAANFSIATGEMNITTLNYRVSGGRLEPVSGPDFVLHKKHQIANLADFCNECGDCDTYCPELGGPFIEKPRFFFSEESYRRSAQVDGFWFAAPDRMLGRIEGLENSLSYDAALEQYCWQSGQIELRLDTAAHLVSSRILNGLVDGTLIETRTFNIMRTLFDGIRNHPKDYPAILLRSDSASVIAGDTNA